MVLLLIRASDGASFPLYRTDLDHITTLDALRTQLLSPLLSIPPECLICMNEEGAQLRDESVPHLAMLAGSPTSSFTTAAQRSLRGSLSAVRASGRRELERRIYVFDRDHLDADPELVARELAITNEQLLTEAELQPPDPLPSHIALSSHNVSSLLLLISSITHQRSSLALALSNLSRVTTSTATSLSLLVESSQPQFEKWDALLNGWEGAMGAVGKVIVVAGLMGRGGNAAASASVMGAQKERVLGDYVSRDKMVAVRDGCEKVFAELRGRTDVLQRTLDEALAGTTLVQEEFDATSRDLEDLEACEHDALEAHQHIEEVVINGEELTDPDLLADCFEELSHIDAEQRDRIRFLVERKNAMTRYLIKSMQRISNLQSDIASMPALLGALDHDLRNKTDNFKHLARLEGLIPAYIATLIEVVRRREFSQLLLAHTNTVSGSLSHLSNSERTRRTNYRMEFSGKLPWEVRGLVAGQEEGLPGVEVAVRAGVDDLPPLGRDVLVGLQNAFAELVKAEAGRREEGPLKEAKEMLDALVVGLDDLKIEFEALSLGQQVNAAIDIESPTVQELSTQIRLLEESKEDLGRQLQAERSGHEEELAQLNQTNSSLAAARAADEETVRELKEKVRRLEIGQAQAVELRSRSEKERSERERERAEGRELVEGLQKEREEREKESELRLRSVRSASDELATQLADVEGRCFAIQSERDELEKELERARSTIEGLETRIKVVEAGQRSLTAAVADKDRLLRDQRGEAELDRAVLGKQLDDLRTVISETEREVKDGSTRAWTLEKIAEGLREQIVRWERMVATKEEELRATKEEVGVAKGEKEKGIVDVQRELVRTTRTARAALKIAGELRDEHNKITAVLTAPPVSKSDSSSDPHAESATAFVDAPPAVISPPTPPLDYNGGDLEELLEEVRKYDRDSLTEAVKLKVESLTSITKKWSKEAKAYRERAHRAAASASDKIAFRNFAKGDLALFLPTRNSTIPVWAAFNVSFPHHFLAATGVISEQIKSREWIVARITSLVEMVVDAKDPSTNPYLLASGTKYFLLEVEPWSSKEASSRSRKHSSVDKGKGVAERRPSTSGHPRISRSESSPYPSNVSASIASSAVLVSAPTTMEPIPSRRSASAALPSNATDLARSEFAIIEEDFSMSPMGSPSTQLQAVPRSEEPFTTLSSSPSALALSLARSPPPTDPFSNTTPYPLVQVAASDRPSVTSLPSTDFDPTQNLSGAFPAFLPRKGTPNSSTSGSRFVRPSSSPIPLHIDASSPASASGSNIAFPRSASSGSSILSSSQLHRHRRASSVFGGKSSSPPSKGIATQEVQEGSSRWNDLTSALGTPPADNKSRTMTVGRTSKGWPSSAGEEGRGTSTTSGSIIDHFRGGSSDVRGKTLGGQTATWGASEIMKKLGGGGAGGG